MLYKPGLSTVCTNWVLNRSYKPGYSTVCTNLDTEQFVQTWYLTGGTNLGTQTCCTNLGYPRYVQTWVLNRSYKPGYSIGRTQQFTQTWVLTHSYRCTELDLQNYVILRICKETLGLSFSLFIILSVSQYFKKLNSAKRLIFVRSKFELAPL